jgi:hypothetical protein
MFMQAPMGYKFDDPGKIEGVQGRGTGPYPNLSKLKNKYARFAPIADSINKELRRR